MKNFMMQNFYKDIVHDEEGICMFGENPDHVYPMKVINEFLGKKVLSINGHGFMVHVFLPEKHMQLWSDKIGSRDDLQVEKNGRIGFRLDKMQQEMGLGAK